MLARSPGRFGGLAVSPPPPPPPLVASFTKDSSTLSASEPVDGVALTDTTTGGSGGNTYEWQGDDGLFATTFSTDQNTHFTFGIADAAGWIGRDVAIVLRVTDSDNIADSSDPQTVTVLAMPVAAFTKSAANINEANPVNGVVFTNTSTGSDLTYSWKWYIDSDPTPVEFATTVDITLTYADFTGAFGPPADETGYAVHVTLTVTNGGGTSTSEQQRIFVKLLHVVTITDVGTGNFTPPTAGLTYWFDMTAAGTPGNTVNPLTLNPANGPGGSGFARLIYVAPDTSDIPYQVGDSTGDQTTWVIDSGNNFASGGDPNGGGGGGGSDNGFSYVGGQGGLGTLNLVAGGGGGKATNKDNGQDASGETGGGTSGDGSLTGAAGDGSEPGDSGGSTAIGTAGTGQSGKLEVMY